MKLKSLKVKGFKNLTGDNGWFNLNFSNTNSISVLIGNNGSGKSNILEVVSSIFKSIFNKNIGLLLYKFEIEYTINNFDIKISNKNTLYYGRKKIENIKYRKIDANVIYNILPLPLPHILVDKPYLPSQVIALYSGEERRLRKEYYQNIYNKYNTDVIHNRVNIDVNQQMIYIDKQYWDIALLTMIASDISIDDIVKNNNLESITIEINLSNLLRFRNSAYNEVVSFVDNFYFDINGQRIDETPTITISIEELKDRLNNETHRRLFNLLCVAKLPKGINDKLITSLELKFENGLSTKDFSEGTKKRILLKLVLNILADDDTLVLFDEPDSHIHVANKEQIKILLDDNKHIETILTTHSPTLMHIFDNNLTYLENGIVSGKEKAEILKEISGDLMSITEQQIILNSNSDILLVEGKTDEIHIEIALKRLQEDYPEYQNLKFEYIPLGGADGLNLFVDKFTPKANQTIIALLDRDETGKGIIKNILNDQNIDFRTFKYRKEKEIFISCYAKKEDFTRGDFVVEDYYDINLFTDFLMKDVIDFKSIPRKDKRKTDFAKYCISHSNKSIFKDFKNLFDLILEIKAQ